MNSKVNIDIPYGEGVISFKIPKKNLIGIVKKSDIKSKINEDAEIRRALSNPIESNKLSHLASKAKNVVILVSDITRPSPSYKFLPFILEELKSIGLQNIVIIFGLGIHRRHTIEERKKLVGEYVYRRVKTIDFDERDCKFLGYTSRGTPIEVYKPYLDFDLKICTGNIEYHYFAGYSGGAKAIMPGISSRRSIEHNHSMMLLPQAIAGVVKGNPVREDIEEAGKMAGIDFIFNIILNDKKEIIRAVAGDYSQAFKEGVKVYDNLFKITIKEPADVVIVSPGGYPKDINFYQAQKALENVEGVVKEGGAIILAANCGDGMGEKVFEKWMLDMTSPDILIKRIKSKFVLGGHKAAAIASVLRKVDIYLVSSFTSEFVRKIGLKPAKSAEEALKLAIDKIGLDTRVLVVPYGRVVNLESN